ncbi:hypothetical protein KUCAC02_005509, partial [Chaenocephalus aceratus]
DSYHKGAEAEVSGQRAGPAGGAGQLLRPAAPAEEQSLLPHTGDTHTHARTHTGSNINLQIPILGDSYDDRSGERPEEARSRQRSPHSAHRRGGARGRRQCGDLQPHLLRERPQSVHGELRGPDPGCGLPRRSGREYLLCGLQDRGRFSQRWLGLRVQRGNSGVQTWRETRREIKVGIIDDDIFEEDEHFFVRLLNLRVGDAEGMFESDEVGAAPKGQLLEPLVATVTILDDDHAGIFTFSERMVRVSESVGTMEVTVVRNSGARGTVILPYSTESGTAKEGEDYEEARGELEFNNDQTTQTFQVRIIDDEEYEKHENFFIVLEEPRWLKRGISALLLSQEGAEGQMSPEEEEARRIAEMGKPILGEHSRLEVVIEESYEFKSTVDKLIKKTNLALVIGTHSWREQFVEAVTVSAGDGDDDEDGSEERLPSCYDYFMHFVTVFWKVLFACVPPTEYWNGWACFLFSISTIGLLTAFIGDLASHFGCTVGLRDTVTAVVFVALGTSIPDTFASKVAAMQDQHADASVGNVTGSNAVNVFLGIGVAWTVAAVYWKVKGKEFRVDPGSLAFSVTLFTIFAFICMGVLLFRRRPSIGGELGGPRRARIATSLLFLSLWFLYILFSSLEAYCHISGF